MEDTFKYVIEKLIMKKYPMITGVGDIKDLYYNLGKSHSSFLGYKYTVDLYTSECLDSNVMMKIDTEIKYLFMMIGTGDYRSDKTPTISAFFDCGDGQGFQFISSYGYNH